MWKEGWVDPGEEVLAVYSNSELPTLSDALASSLSANMHMIKTIIDSQGATFDGFLTQVCCLFFGVGVFVGVMLFKLPAVVALQST